MKKYKYFQIPLRRSLIIFSRILGVGGAILVLLWAGYASTHPLLPNAEYPILLYSNQTRDNLKLIFQKVIQQTKRSLFIQMYGCTDKDILDKIYVQHQKGTKVQLLYDPTGSGPLQKIYPFAHPRSCKGLMHKKIVILDGTQVWLGSANFTTQSLKMHDNLVVGLHSPRLADFLDHSLEQTCLFPLVDQQGEFWHLPDIQNRCLNRILTLLQAAEKSVFIAIFTFTHPKILDTLIQLHNKGIQIEVAVDAYAAKGAGKKIVDALKKGGIKVLLSKGDKLLHHKWALIDETTLITGSANWTRSAFSRNEDYILIIRPLTLKQKKYMQSICRLIHINSL